MQFVAPIHRRVCQSFSGFVNIDWEPLLLLGARERQVELPFQGRPQGNTAIHLQRLGPAFILVVGLTVLHPLMGTAAGKQNRCQPSGLGSGRPSPALNGRFHSLFLSEGLSW